MTPTQMGLERIFPRPGPSLQTSSLSPSPATCRTPGVVDTTSRRVTIGAIGTYLAGSHYFPSAKSAMFRSKRSEFKPLLKGVTCGVQVDDDGPRRVK